MEYLNKSQIILLALFVSFVSSMATGIVVVTLMQQAPEPVFQTITNVIEKTIEKTIEKIVPTIVEKPGQIIVIKDEDLMIAAIERNSKSVVAFSIAGEDGEIRSAGVGVIVSADGLVITDKSNIGGGVLTTTVNGIKYALEVISYEKDALLGLGKLIPFSKVSTSTPAATFIPVAFGNAGALKVGQTAIVISGRDGRTINTGFVSRLDTRTVIDKETKVETKVLYGIGLSERFYGTSNGAPIITLEGVVVGFLSIDENIGSQIGVPSSEAQNLISTYSLPAPAEKAQ